MVSEALVETPYLDLTFPALVKSKGLGDAVKIMDRYLELRQKYKPFPIIENSILLDTYLHPSALPILDRLVSVYFPPVTNTTNQIPVPIRKVAAGIGSTLYEERTNEYWNITDQAEAADFKKTKFCYATWSGTFYPKRKDANLVQHSGIICADLDHLGSKLQEVRECIINDPATVLAFISPSGDGLKVLYEVEPGDYSQRQHYEAIRARLTDLFGIPGEGIDPHCKDLSRACFLPFDPTIYVNPDLA